MTIFSKATKWKFAWKHGPNMFKTCYIGMLWCTLTMVGFYFHWKNYGIISANKKKQTKQYVQSEQKFTKKKSILYNVWNILLQADARHNVKSVFNTIVRGYIYVFNSKNLAIEPEGTMNKSTVDKFNAFPFDSYIHTTQLELNAIRTIQI